MEFLVPHILRTLEFLVALSLRIPKKTSWMLVTSRSNLSDASVICASKESLVTRASSKRELVERSVLSKLDRSLSPLIV